ncbi:MAG: hypothetical protein U0R24_00935 [Solirubrobacterales bacterium]
MLDLHDATLLDVRLDWEQGTARIRFQTNKATASLTVNGLASVVIPRREPWGSSASVNELREVTDGLEIEMQSGDVIQIEASAWTVTSE